MKVEVEIGLPFSRFAPLQTNGVMGRKVIVWPLPLGDGKREHSFFTEQNNVHSYRGIYFFKERKLGKSAEKIVKRKNAIN